jgi:DNA-binding winged helix-turn-helix (wHTH) protein
MRLRFAKCVLDTDLRALTRGDQLVQLKPMQYRLLEVLIERRPKAVSQAELRDLLWPDVEMGGTTLARLVSEVRFKIGDTKNEPQLIRTIHRFGYAFCGSVEREPLTSAPRAEKAAYAVQWNKQLVPLAAGENLIGRATDAHISIASPEVSRRHARILVTNQAVTLEDLGSRNGTFLGKHRVTGSVRLKHRDRIRVGPALLVFYVAADEETAEARGR